MAETSPEKISAALIQVIAEYRKANGLTLEELADKAGIHRTTIGLLERNERSPTVDSVLRLAGALDVELSVLLARAEAMAGGQVGKSAKAVTKRLVKDDHFTNARELQKRTGLTRDCLKKAIEGCYQTLDTIDFELALHDTLPIARLVELANLSSMIGNILGGGIAAHSNGLYQRNLPHSYPDLLPIAPNRRNIELKLALESNSPKGHLAKAGNYMTFRYVLGDKQGNYSRGKDKRGDTAFVWEVRVGELCEEDFVISNTAGDSGKTATIKTAAFDAMTVVYYVPAFLPYAKARKGHASF